MTLGPVLDAASLKNREHLPPYVQRLLEGLLPVLARLDKAKLNAKSSVEVKNEQRGWMLELQIDAADPDIPGVSLTASREQCIVGFAESEQIECHSDPEAARDLVPMALAAITAYLNGITIRAHYNKNDRLVKKEFFFGIEGTDAAQRPMGVASYPLVFPKRIARSMTKTYRFFR